MLWFGKWKKLNFGHAILRYLIYFHFGNFATIFVQFYHGKLTPVPSHSVARLMLIGMKQFLKPNFELKLHVLFGILQKIILPVFLQMEKVFQFKTVCPKY